MNSNSLQELVADTDIYLLDQIMKGRYRQTDKILDSGCGTGRNLHWFLKEKMDVYGIDQNPDSIAALKNAHPELAANRFQNCRVEQLPFAENFFDHIISSAVLHFANDNVQFHNMLAEMIRVLKPGGSLFIRMTSDIGIEHLVKVIKDGVYIIPDGSKRFLLTRSLLADIVQQHSLSFIEPFKTVNVEDTRCMSTLVLQKENQY
ncbi:MAG: class I SAM-dependent methyltransferase [Chitinophagaceae bacterium]